MQINIQGEGLELTEALKDYATKKLAKFEHFFHNIQKVDIDLEVDKIKEDLQKQVAKVTVFASGTIFHAKEASESMYASIDSIVDKVDHQIKKYKEKLIDEKRREVSKAKHSFVEPENAPDIQE